MPSQTTRYVDGLFRKVAFLISRSCIEDMLMYSIYGEINSVQWELGN